MYYYYICLANNGAVRQQICVVGSWRNPPNIRNKNAPVISEKKISYSLTVVMCASSFRPSHMTIKPKVLLFFRSNICRNKKTYKLQMSSGSEHETPVNALGFNLKVWRHNIGLSSPNLVSLIPTLRVAGPAHDGAELHLLRVLDRALQRVCHHAHLPLPRWVYSSHCNENPIYVFLSWELRGLSLNFHIHVSVSD